MSNRNNTRVSVKESQLAEMGLAVVDGNLVKVKRSARKVMAEGSEAGTESGRKFASTLANGAVTTSDVLATAIIDVPVTGAKGIGHFFSNGRAKRVAKREAKAAQVEATPEAATA